MMNNNSGVATNARGNKAPRMPIYIHNSDNAIMAKHAHVRTAMANLGNPSKCRSFTQVPTNANPRSKHAPSDDITADQMASFYHNDCSGVVVVVVSSSRRAANVENVTRNMEPHAPDTVTPNHNEASMEVMQQSEERVESVIETAASRRHAAFMSGVGASSHLYCKPAASASGIETAAALRLSYLYSSKNLYLEYNDKKIDSDTCHGSSSFLGDFSDEEEEQQQQEVEPFDVSEFFAVVQSEHQSSISRCSAAPAVVTYSARRGGQTPLYSTEKQAVEDVREARSDRDELHWQARVSAHTTTVEDEEAEPCCAAAPMEEHIVATSMAVLCCQQG
ncbi:hypothetical protein FOA52_006090 [Chlamydomonas sp. UWO 241]|nr:hypothetical protein FOA52_006090 [Chlamydomonas sp. UWO 241]